METLKIRRGNEKLPIIYNAEPMIKEIKAKNNIFYESDMLEFIAKMPYRSGLWLDIGANVGNHTIFFSRFCNPDEVWAYEPNKATFDILRQNIAANCTRTVRAFNCAIGAKKGYCNFSDLVNTGINKVIKGKGDTRMETITATAKVALMKIDVEGYELNVLKGAADVIERDKPELFIETHGKPEKLLELLPEGYKIIRRYNNAPTYYISYQA